MTEAKQKARELLNRYLDLRPLETSMNDTLETANKKNLADRELAKQYASIAVDELIELAIVYDGFRPPLFESAEAYYREVKTEIENL